MRKILIIPAVFLMMSGFVGNTRKSFEKPDNIKKISSEKKLIQDVQTLDSLLNVLPGK